MAVPRLSRILLAALRQNLHRRPRRNVPWCRDPLLRTIYLYIHALILADPKPMSGRFGGYVYYWAYGHLCWRVCVVPRDLRTPKQRAARAALGAASKAWSDYQPLTEALRELWRAAAATIQSHPRLWQSGTLTPQQHYVGCNVTRDRWGQPLLLAPPTPASKNTLTTPQNPESAVQSSPAQPLARPSSDLPRPETAPRLSPSRPAALATTRYKHAPFFPYVLRRPATALTHHASRITSWPTFAPAHRTARCRELWRGG